MRWFTWDGTRWAVDNTGEVFRRAKQTMLTIHREIDALPHKTDRDVLSKHALRSESDARLGAMLSLARSQDGIWILPEHLDQDPGLLNVLSGTVDLRSGRGVAVVDRFRPPEPPPREA